MDFRFRPATAQDAAGCAPLVHASSPELYDYIYATAAKSAIEFLAFELGQGGGFGGHRVHTIVERDGAIAGIGAFYRHELLSQLNLEATQNLLRFYGVAGAREVVRKAAHGLSVIGKPGAGEVYAANLATVPAMRGQGVCSALLAHAGQLARGQGCAAMTLDVALNNPRAEALYRRVGFVSVRDNAFAGDANAGVPGTRFMRLALA